MDNQQYHYQQQQFKQHDRSRTKWTSSLDKLFVDLVLQQVLLGNRSNNVFNKIAWKHIRDEFNRQTGLDFNRKQLKKHLDVLRNRYDNVKSQFVPTTGFTGDMLLSGTDVWDDYILEDYPMGETTKMKDFPIYDQLCKIFSEAGGIGRYAQSSHYIDIEKETETQIQPQPQHSSCPKTTINPLPMQDDSLNGKMPVKRKRNNGSGLLDQDAIAEAMMEMASASKLRANAALKQCSGDQFAITKCVEELDKISENLDERLYYAALDLFDDASMREMFLSLRADRRLVWLHGKCAASCGGYT
ncbi:hypothetical protein ACHQM5_026759 [Ranunculus cassubicifolius]